MKITGFSLALAATFTLLTWLCLAVNSESIVCVNGVHLHHYLLGLALMAFATPIIAVKGFQREIKNLAVAFFVFGAVLFASEILGFIVGLTPLPVSC